MTFLYFQTVIPKFDVTQYQIWRSCTVLFWSLRQARKLLANPPLSAIYWCQVISLGLWSHRSTSHKLLLSLPLAAICWSHIITLVLLRSTLHKLLVNVTVICDLLMSIVSLGLWLHQSTSHKLFLSPSPFCERFVDFKSSRWCYTEALHTSFWSRPPSSASCWCRVYGCALWYGELSGTEQALHRFVIVYVSLLQYVGQCMIILVTYVTIIWRTHCSRYDGFVQYVGVTHNSSSGLANPFRSSIFLHACALQYVDLPGMHCKALSLCTAMHRSIRHASQFVENFRTYLYAETFQTFRSALRKTRIVALSVERFFWHPSKGGAIL